MGTLPLPDLTLQQLKINIFPNFLYCLYNSSGICSDLREEFLKQTGCVIVLVTSGKYLQLICERMFDFSRLCVTSLKKASRASSKRVSPVRACSLSQSCRMTQEPEAAGWCDGPPSQQLLRARISASVGSVNCTGSPDESASVLPFGLESVFNS